MNPRLRNKMKSKLADDDSLTSMFTDIVQTFEQQRQDKYQVEDQMLQMAIAFEKTRVAFVELAADSDHYAQENKSLSNQLKTIQTKYRVARDSLYDEQKTREKLQKDLVELESTLALMSEIVFDNKDNKIKLDASQRSKLVRACSLKRTTSTVNTPRRQLLRAPSVKLSDETFDETQMDNSDISFDETMDESMLNRDTPFKTPRKGKRSIDTLRMDDTNIPEAQSTICTDSDDSRTKKIRCDIPSGEEMTTTVTGPAVVEVSQSRRRSGGKKEFLRPTGHTARKRQSRHYRRSMMVEEDKIVEEDETEIDTSADSFFTPVSAVGTIKARKILGANESQISNDKFEIEHKFSAKRCVTVETCRVCYGRIKFYQSCQKCNTCRVIVHPECVSKLDVGCTDPNAKIDKIAIVGPRTLSEMLINKDQKPKIPPAIYLAVHEVDQRLTEEGIYRISGSVKSLQEIKKKLLFGEVANVKWPQVDVHTLTAFIKDFLRLQLSEPILTFRQLPQFIEASANNNSESMKRLIKKLPEVNRDTLSFLIVHLQNVVTNSDRNKMASTALARSIGPSLVGFQSKHPTPDQIKSAAKYQEQVVENLLMLPTKFYYGFIADGDLTN